MIRPGIAGKTLRCPAVVNKLNSFSLIHQERNSGNPTDEGGIVFNREFNS